MGSQQAREQEMLAKQGKLPPDQGQVKFASDPKQNQKAFDKNEKKRKKSPNDSQNQSQLGQPGLQQQQDQINRQGTNKSLQLPSKAKKGVRIAGDDYEEQQQQQPINLMNQNQTGSILKQQQTQNQMQPVNQSAGIANQQAQKVGSNLALKVEKQKQDAGQKKASPSRQNSKDKKSTQKVPDKNQPKKRKMREVTDAKRQRFVDATTRIINMQTAKKIDLMLCVKEDQLAIAQHILSHYNMIDLIDVRGFEDFATIKVQLEISAKNPNVYSKEFEKSFQTKLWNPLNWAFYLQKQQYIRFIYENLPIHLSHCLDLNPGKFDIESIEEGFLNKGKAHNMLMTIYNKNYDDFYYAWNQSYRYLSGWYVFSAFRCMIECEWDIGIQRFLMNDIVYKIILAMPIRNRNDLIENMRQFSYLKARQIGLHQIVEEYIDQIIMRLDKDDSMSKHETTTTELYEIIRRDDASALEQFFIKNSVKEITLFSGKHYKGNQELKITYKSPVDMLSHTIRDEQFNPMTFAIVCNSIRCIEFFVQKTEINLLYCTAKPGSYDLNSVCALRNQIFPLTFCIINEYFDLFQYFFESLFSLWRVEHLKLILDEIIDSQNPTLIEYILTHPRTHILFNYLSYLDRQLLVGYFFVSKDPYILQQFEPLLRQKPYLGPLVFYIMTNLDLIQEKFDSQFDSMLTDEDIADYIEGVGSDQALFMVSEICVSCPGGMENIDGLEELVERIENHYAYF
eukprot:403356837